jgi:hopanoid biosynthesis associated protein HpnK
MVTGEAFEEAVRLARAHPTLAVGIHLVLVDGWSALPPARIPHLVDRLGRFRPGPVVAGFRAQFPPIAASELRQEMRAQLERFRETGLPLSHVDGHHHLHLHPVVLDTLAALAREFGIRTVRLPVEETDLAKACGLRVGPGAGLGSRVFRLLRRQGERLLEPAGVSFHERVYGRLATGRVDEAYLLRLLPRLDAEAVEIYCHPELPADGEANGVSTATGVSEFAALTSPAVRRAIVEAGFTLTGPVPEEFPGSRAGEFAEPQASLG